MNAPDDKENNSGGGAGSSEGGGMEGGGAGCCGGHQPDLVPGVDERDAGAARKAQVEGRGLYALFSCTNHACAPNAINAKGAADADALPVAGARSARAATAAARGP